MTNRTGPSLGYNTRAVSARVAAAKGTGYKRGRLWHALRILRNATAYDLMAVAEVPSRGHVLRFLWQLRRAGYVRSRPGRTNQEPTVYTLIRDTGPKCPSVLRRGTVVYDHNTEQEHPINGTE